MQMHLLFKVFKVSVAKTFDHASTLHHVTQASKEIDIQGLLGDLIL